jgi:hypothetical protein
LRAHSASTAQCTFPLQCVVQLAWRGPPIRAPPIRCRAPGDVTPGAFGWASLWCYLPSLCACFGRCSTLTCQTLHLRVQRYSFADAIPLYDSKHIFHIYFNLISLLYLFLEPATFADVRIYVKSPLSIQRHSFPDLLNLASL